MNKLVYVMAALALLLMLPGCSQPEETTVSVKTVPWPTEGWETATPEEQGMDGVRLAEISTFVTNNNLKIDSVLVTRNGYLIYELYPNPKFTAETPHNIASITKSYVSACIAIAIEQGYIKGMDQTLTELFPNRTIANLDERKQRMTLENILTMKSGLEWNEWTVGYGDPSNDLYKAANSIDPIKYVLDKPMAEEPGQTFNYNGGTANLLSALITEITGQNALAFATANLFEPLGINDVLWNKDRLGNNLGGAGISMKPRDMAKFGYLYLNNGIWNGQQILTADFCQAATTTHTKRTSSTGYGYQSWWTSLSDNTYYTSGLNGQRILIDPEANIVAVITSSFTSDAEANNWCRQIWDYYIRGSITADH